MTAIVRDLAQLREQIGAWRREGDTIGLVPTMGALHAGHLALVRAARDEAARVVVTIFVNPTQFAPNEDFAAYPRDLDADVAKVAAEGADLVYAPDVAGMYPDGFATTVEVAGPAKVGLEDRFRPTHFAGVATVVGKLFARVQPTLAIFGEKDFQQLRVIERFTRDLDLPVQVKGLPTIREPDGLAMSSRNAYLSHDERRRAPVLHATLARCAAALEQGADQTLALAEAAAALEDFAIDYIEARDDATLQPWSGAGPGRLLAACRLGRTRLIDNVGFSR